MIRMITTRTLIVTCCMAGLASAQINLNANAINFRTSAQNTQKTVHYGNLQILGANTASSGATKVIEVNDQTGSSTNTERYGIHCTVKNASGQGNGGYFEGAAIGLRAYALTDGTTDKIGLVASANNNSTDATKYSSTYGIRANGSASGSKTVTTYGIYAQGQHMAGGTSYAGYFNGNVAYTGNLTKVSDGKLKKNIQRMGKSLNRIKQLNPVTYDYDESNHRNFNLPEKKQLGLIAQEVEEIFPEIVHEEIAPEDNDQQNNAGSDKPPETYKSVDYISLIPVLVAAIKEQQEEIEELKEELRFR